MYWLLEPTGILYSMRVKCTDSDPVKRESLNYTYNFTATCIINSTCQGLKNFEFLGLENTISGTIHVDEEYHPIIILNPRSSTFMVDGSKIELSYNLFISVDTNIICYE